MTKNQFKNLIRSFIKVPKDAGWLIPGLEVKRWFALIIIGVSLAIFGLCIVLNLKPIYWLLSVLMKLVKVLHSEVIGIGLILVGAYIFLKGWAKTNYSILNVNDQRERQDILEDLYRRRKLNKGPKIVAIGGGTGLSTLLKGIKKLSNNITAVVTVGDDGGSSGRLREEMGVLPPGDIRNCIAALANAEDLVTKLFQYRFKSGKGIEGHSFGNLFLTAMCSITGDMLRAVKESSKVLSIRGRVLPSTLDDMRLVAKMDTGEIVKGESNIPEANGKIIELSCEPSDCKTLPEIILAIQEADLIIMGPGSLYTSVIPNLLIKDISKAIAESKAKKIYVCNVMTQPGETDGYSVSDHINAIKKHAKEDNIIDAVLVNDNFPEDALEKYKEANQIPVEVDDAKINDMGIQVVKRRLIEESTGNLVRHSPQRVARAIHYWYHRG
ncbi:YvcK family protein [bacterium]|nr:YvcK family protein [bacterium]